MRGIDLFDNYCYGPVELLRVHRATDGMYFQLRSGEFRTATAYYAGCVYSDLCERHTGIRFPMVRRVEPGQLMYTAGFERLVRGGFVSRIGKAVDGRWSFYLHHDSRGGEGFLVVCRELQYKEA